MDTGDIIDFSGLDPEVQSLIRESVAAREQSYSPYSNFKVGAALLCSDGTVSRGCNVENASFCLSICAERTAFARAVSEGKRSFKMLAVVADHHRDTYTSPCGACRQTIAEFGDMPVYLSRSDMKNVLRTSVYGLLPLSFKLLNAAEPNGH